MMCMHYARVNTSKTKGKVMYLPCRFHANISRANHSQSCVLKCVCVLSNKIVANNPLKQWRI